MMTYVMFSHPVKYKGVKYPAHTEIEVLKKDLKEVTDKGGWVIEKEKPTIKAPEKTFKKPDKATESDNDSSD